MSIIKNFLGMKIFKLVQQVDEEELMEEPTEEEVFPEDEGDWEDEGEFPEKEDWEEEWEE